MRNLYKNEIRGELVERENSEEDENRQGGGGSPGKVASVENLLSGAGGGPIPG